LKRRQWQRGTRGARVQQQLRHMRHQLAVRLRLRLRLRARAPAAPCGRR
jgi:hypothetical protein